MTSKPKVTQLAQSSPSKGHRWFAALYDRLSRSEEKNFLGAMRQRSLAGLQGDVLEIGAGTGANFEHYPPGVRVIALEPDPFMLRRARAKLSSLNRTDIALDQRVAEELPADARFDAVVSTLVLCTVRDVERSLAEIRRVLRPGGEVRFIEHVRAKGMVGRLQDIIKPVWRYVGAGCNPNRRTVDALQRAGFNVTITEHRKIMGFAPLIAGTALPKA